MTKKIKKAVVLGNGGWGTSLALILHGNGIDTRLWCAFPEEAEELRKTRRNERYLSNVELPEGLHITADPFRAAKDIDLCVSAVPTQFLRSVAERFEDALPGHVPIASATKGIEIESFKRPDEILKDALGRRPFCAISGPTHAEEVARGLPASAVAASHDEELASAVQEALSCDSLRVYTNNDPVGAQLGGALKNVIAIAAGISDGLGLGDNAKAALVTRGIVEMARFGKNYGAKAETFFGLAGIGDLATTCYSLHSRNRGVGERIGRGATLETILAEMKMVAEGVWTTKALFGPESEGRRVQMPIAEQVNAILFEKQDPRQAVLELMRRDLSGEMDGIVS